MTERNCVRCPHSRTGETARVISVLCRFPGRPPRVMATFRRGTRLVLLTPVKPEEGSCPLDEVTL